MKGGIVSVLSVSAAMILLLAGPVLFAEEPGGTLARGDAPIGVWANSNTNSIQVIDPETFTVSKELLQGQFGSYGGALFDVVITPDGKTAIVSNFGDSTVYFIDLTYPTAPVVLGSVLLSGWGGISIFAEDMTVTPDGRTLLVTDGGFMPYIAVVDIPTRTLTGVTPYGDLYMNAIEMAPDGQTIIAVDYFQGRVYVFTLEPLTRVPKHLLTYDLMNPSSWPAGVSVPPDFNMKWFQMRPINVAISPDGKTAIVNCAIRDQAAIFRIWGPGNVSLESIVAPGGYRRDPQENPATLPDYWYVGSQSIAFTPDGKRAYLGYVTPTTFLPWGQDPGMKFTEIVAVDITGPGQATPAGVHIEIKPWRGTSQLFGVDTMAVDPSGNYLWYTNPTLSGAIFSTALIDLRAQKELFEIPSAGYDDSPVPTPSIPVGIAFWSKRTAPPGGSITVTSPAGGEQWARGSAHDITWTSSGITGNVTINLYRNGGLVGWIARNVPAANGVFNWTAGAYKANKMAKRGKGYAVQVITTDGSVQSTSPTFKLTGGS